MILNSPTLNIIYKACIKAAKPLMRDFGEIENLQVSKKGPGDFVTNADKRTEKIIMDVLTESKPDVSFITEESGMIENSSQKKFWVIDPIDGTTNFLKGIPHFAISVAYMENNEIKSGIVFDPIKNEMFVAEKGLGSFLNNKRIRVSKQKILKDAIIVTGGPNFSSKIKNKTFEEYVEFSKKLDSPIRKLGCAALDVAYIACGRLDGFWHNELNLWDVGAGAIILKEAGGYIEYIHDKPTDVFKRKVLASNYLIHEDMKKHLNLNL